MTYQLKTHEIEVLKWSGKNKEEVLNFVGDFLLEVGENFKEKSLSLKYETKNRERTVQLQKDNYIFKRMLKNGEIYFGVISEQELNNQYEKV
jgi:hypothetical protein